VDAGSNGAAARPAAGEHPHDDHDEDGADGRHDDRADVEGTVDGMGIEQDGGQPAPTSAPTIPMTTWPMTPSPSSPLTRNPARYPAMAPSTIHAMMLTVVPPGTFGPEVRDERQSRSP